MNILISAKRLLTFSVFRSDVNRIIRFLNIELINARRSGLSFYIWTPYDINSEDGKLNETAINIILDKFTKFGYFYTSIFEGDNVSYKIFWEYNKLIEDNLKLTKSPTEEEYERRKQWEDEMLEYNRNLNK
jgi:hypothetical protein